MPDPDAPLPNTLLLEVWRDVDDLPMVCESGPRGDGARDLLADGASLAWIFAATSHVDAMTQFNARMNRGEYATNQPWDMLSYPPEWVANQQEWLANTTHNPRAVSATASAQAWRDAAADLAIRFESPFGFRYRGVTYWCAGLLPDFGGPKGLVITGALSLDGVFDAADALCFYWSALNPLYFDHYDRKRFVDTLNDWGWYSEPSDVPAWYTEPHLRRGR